MMMKFFLWTTLSIVIMMTVINKNPILMGSMVITQAMLTSLLISFNFLSSIFSFFIFIIYLGGILMLFSYVISLINFKTPILNKKLMKNVIISSSILSLLNMAKKNESFSKEKKTMDYLSLCYSNSMKMTIFMMIFLLMIMIMVVFITQTTKKNMRTI